MNHKKLLWGWHAFGMSGLCIAKDKGEGYSWRLYKMLRKKEGDPKVKRL